MSGDRENRPNRASSSRIRAHEAGDQRVVEYGASRCEGPIPLPEVARGWQEILPDAPERILAMAEREQAERHRIARAEVDEDLRDGQCQRRVSGVLVMVATLMPLTGAGIAVWASLEGYREVAIGGIAAFSLPGLAKVIGAFLPHRDGAA